MYFLFCKNNRHKFTVINCKKYFSRIMQFITVKLQKSFCGYVQGFTVKTDSKNSRYNEDLDNEQSRL